MGLDPRLESPGPEDVEADLLDALEAAGLPDEPELHVLAAEGGGGCLEKLLDAQVEADDRVEQDAQADRLVLLESHLLALGQTGRQGSVDLASEEQSLLFLQKSCENGLLLKALEGFDQLLGFLVPGTLDSLQELVARRKRLFLKGLELAVADLGRGLGRGTRLAQVPTAIALLPRLKSGGSGRFESRARERSRFDLLYDWSAQLEHHQRLVLAFDRNQGRVEPGEGQLKRV